MVVSTGRCRLKFLRLCRSIVAEEIKELDFSNNKAIEDIDRNVEQFGNLHNDLDGGRTELDEVQLVCLINCFVSADIVPHLLYFLYDL